MCTDAYREALTRDLSSTASSAPTSTPATSQHQAAESGREDAVGGRSGAVCPAVYQDIGQEAWLNGAIAAREPADYAAAWTTPEDK